MATRKEQLTAVEFARRRVLGAVLRPGAANPDEATPRPARTLFAAFVVVTVALGVATVVGFMSPKPPPEDWRQGLIKDGAGTSYVLLAGRLHQVANQTSAKLILGSQAKTSTQSEKTLGDLKANQGPVVGLPDLPDPLPKPADLDLKGWSACATPAGKTVVEVGYPPAAGALSGAASLLVQDDAGQQWVVSNGLKYKVFDHATVTAAFHAQSVRPRHVPAPWLGGLATGDPLGVPTISGKFGTAITHPAPAGFNRVGMYGRSTATDGTPVYYLVSVAGLATVSPTMYELYQHEPRLASYKFTEQTLPPGRITPDMLAVSSETLVWPVEPPTFSPAAQNPQDPASAVLCAAFDGSFDQQGHPHLTISVSSALPHPPTPATALAAIQPGHAALVRDSGSDAATATCHLLTDAGLRYQLVGNAAAKLGYEGVACAEVPAVWLRLIPAGPALDPARAAEAVQTANPTAASTSAPLTTTGQTSTSGPPPTLPIQPGSS
jgi:type VII secretion protein EccB